MEYDDAWREADRVLNAAHRGREFDKHFPKDETRTSPLGRAAKWFRATWRAKVLPEYRRRLAEKRALDRLLTFRA